MKLSFGLFRTSEPLLDQFIGTSVSVVILIVSLIWRKMTLQWFIFGDAGKNKEKTELKKPKKRELFIPAPWYQPHPSPTPAITPLVIQPYSL